MTASIYFVDEEQNIQAVGKLADDSAVIDQVKNGFTGDFSAGGRSFSLVEVGSVEGKAVFSCHELTGLKQQLDLANRNAMIDELTELPTRRFVLQHLDAIASDVANGRFEIAVIYIDLDNFKKYNDLYGHSFGDEILRVAARRFKGCVRAKDVVARMGGDEYLIVVHVQPQEDVRMVVTHVVDRVFQAFDTEMLINSVNADIKCSAGICEIKHGDLATSAEAIRRADSAMFQAKNSGRSRYAFYVSKEGFEANKSLGSGELDVTSFLLHRDCVFKSSRETLYKYTLTAKSYENDIDLSTVSRDVLSYLVDAFRCSMAQYCSAEDVNLLVVTEEYQLHILEIAKEYFGEFIHLAILDSLLERHQEVIDNFKQSYRSVGVYIKLSSSITAVLTLMGSVSIIYVECCEWSKNLDESSAQILNALDQLSSSSSTRLILDGLTESNLQLRTAESFFRRFTYDINR